MFAQTVYPFIDLKQFIVHFSFLIHNYFIITGLRSFKIDGGKLYAGKSMVSDPTSALGLASAHFPTLMTSPTIIRLARSSSKPLSRFSSATVILCFRAISPSVSPCRTRYSPFFVPDGKEIIPLMPRIGRFPIRNRFWFPEVTSFTALDVVEHFPELIRPTKVGLRTSEVAFACAAKATIRPLSRIPDVMAFRMAFCTSLFFFASIVFQ